MLRTIEARYRDLLKTRWRRVQNKKSQQSSRELFGYASVTASDYVEFCQVPFSLKPMSPEVEPPSRLVRRSSEVRTCGSMSRRMRMRAP